MLSFVTVRTVYRTGTTMRHGLSSVVALATLVACSGQGAPERAEDPIAPTPASTTVAPFVEEPHVDDAEGTSEPPPAELPPAEPSTPLDAELLISALKSSGSSHPHAFTVLSERAQVLEHWQNAIGDDERPLDERLDVDLGSNVIIFADLGEQPDIWRHFAAVSARKLEDRVEVELVIGAPGYCERATALSYPYAFVRVALSDLPYVAVEREELPDCE